eukprot:SAG22_NODE_6538_length_842_cov_0.709287_2_plen_43_part_01
MSPWISRAQGDDQSTDGVEPSHSHFVGDLGCDRGEHSSCYARA